ncbi:hypothetical protein N657DRAFT_693683 [Parathielavia appendiculata]|uniref:Uncharacterized protein n=1 Tax=Parathielavia appendiculata TaxID=2587402 RepID=A0AAN6TRR3_9PEZI|nr:hypothetical protein N657DRAFT_693683 [Parathielavia appendiculata]
MLKVRGYLRQLQLAGASVAGNVYKYRKNLLVNPATQESVGDIFLDFPRMSTDLPLDVWCMPVLHFGPGRASLASICLALVPVLDDEDEQQMYKRVGLVKITNKKWDRNFFPAIGQRIISFSWSTPTKNCSKLSSPNPPSSRRFPFLASRSQSFYNGSNFLPTQAIARVAVKYAKNWVEEFKKAQAGPPGPPEPDTADPPAAEPPKVDPPIVAKPAGVPAVKRATVFVG